MRLAPLALLATLLGLTVGGAQVPVPGLGEAPRQGSEQAPVGDSEPDLVVLLHGMGRTIHSMAPLERALVAAGYDVLNLGYSSYCCPIAELGASVREELDAKRGEHTRVHFVGHSLGGILARWMVVQPSPPPGVGRIVMIAPPNQGSHSADFFSPVAGWLLEPMAELRTDTGSTVRRLPPPQGIEVGVIAGRHDGKVSVEETHLAGETAHVVVDENHAFIMRSEEVARLTIAFLREGSFRSVHLAAEPR